MIPPDGDEEERRKWLGEFNDNKNNANNLPVKRKADLSDQMAGVNLQDKEVGAQQQEPKKAKKELKANEAYAKDDHLASLRARLYAKKRALVRYC